MNQGTLSRKFGRRLWSQKVCLLHTLICFKTSCLDFFATVSNIREKDLKILFKEVLGDCICTVLAYEMAQTRRFKKHNSVDKSC